MKKLSFSSLLITAITLLLATIIGAKLFQFKSMADAAENMVLPPETVSTFTIEKQSWTKSLHAIGTIDPIQGVLLQSEIDGVVNIINFDNGQEVKKGDMLIQLDISVEKAELKAAKALAHLAKLELERAKRLQKSGSIPESELDRAFAEAARRNAEVENIEARIDRKTLYAPFNGIVGIRKINLGQYIASGTAIVSLQENESVYVNFSLPQNEISNVNNGYIIKLTCDAYPQQNFEGELTAISPEIDPKTRSFSLQGTFINSEALLKPGLFVRLEIFLPGLDEVIVIPSTAIIYAPYGNSVYKIEESENGTIARQHFITTGRQKGDFISITKGAKLGDIVVSAGAFKLRNGISVRVNNDLAPEPELKPVPNNS